MRSSKGVVCCVAGTRPEAIKMSPVILELAKSRHLKPFVLATGQHTEIMHRSFSFFGISPDMDLGIMKENQSLDYVTSAVLEKTGKVFDHLKPFMVLVHGDTTTTMAASLAAFYRKIRLAHVEAGLRSGSIDLPFPEELNRIVADRASGWWFVPTEGARNNLLREGCDPARVIKTGNTVIDALLWSIPKIEDPLNPCLNSIPPLARVMLLTVHRRESWGDTLKGICRSVKKILFDSPDLWVIIPMHPNPVVRDTVRSFFEGAERVILSEPLDYPDFVWAMKRSDIILTDSGGVQEETTVLGTPTMVMRNVTERPEALEYGTSFLVGTDPEKIFETASKVLNNTANRIETFTRSGDPPFGSGDAARIIVRTIENLFLTI